MKIALVHDHLFEFGGAERVFVALKRIFPVADVYVADYDKHVAEKNIPDFSDWSVHTSWAHHIPFFKKLYSPLRFLTPWIWESLDFSMYDLVISSSGWFMSKGIITKPKTKHISYIHHQPRYLYFYETAIEWQKYLPVRIYAHFINHFLRIWDFSGSQRPDVLIANSEETKKRIQKFYRRDSIVIYPPVDIPETLHIAHTRGDYYLTTSRLTKTKNIDLLIRAANKNKFNLKIIGQGRDEAYLKSLAGPTVEFLGYIPDNKFAEIMSGAQAFLFASVDEEFGIAPIEAMGYGLPVIAYESGGLKETVMSGVNGFLFKELSEESLQVKIDVLEKLSDDEYISLRKNARKEAEKYSFDEFKKKIIKVVSSSQSMSE